MDPISNAKLFCENCDLQFLNRAKLHFHSKVVHNQNMNQIESAYVSSDLEKVAHKSESDLNKNQTEPIVCIILLLSIQRPPCNDVCNACYCRYVSCSTLS